MKKINIIICFLLITLIFVGCKNVTSSQNDTIEFGFDTKSATYEDENGWVYYCYVDYDRNVEIQEATTLFYDFGAYNIKYKNLDKFDKIPVYDSITNEIIEYIETDVPGLHLNEAYSSDIMKISNYLNQKSFKNIISAEDLEDLKIENINKTLLVDLFNKMINSSKKEDGVFYNYKESDITQESNFKNSYKWQIGYFVSHGVLLHIDIELLIDNSGKVTNLSDLISAGSGTNEQIEIQEKINQIEENIIRTQDLFSESYDDVIGNVEFNRLKILLQSLTEG